MESDKKSAVSSEIDAESLFLSLENAENVLKELEWDDNADVVEHQSVFRLDDVDELTDLAAEASGKDGSEVERDEEITSSLLKPDSTDEIKVSITWENFVQWNIDAELAFQRDQEETPGEDIDESKTATAVAVIPRADVTTKPTFP